MPQSARLVLNQANLRASVAAFAAFAAFAGSGEAPGASAAIAVNARTLFISAQITTRAAQHTEEL